MRIQSSGFLKSFRSHETRTIQVIQDSAADSVGITLFSLGAQRIDRKRRLGGGLSVKDPGVEVKASAFY
jgi:hypothetical protein